jgi:hypothetical protein
MLAEILNFMSATLSWRDDSRHYGNDLRWRTGAIMQAGKHSGDILKTYMDRDTGQK